MVGGKVDLMSNAGDLNEGGDNIRHSQTADVLT